ncbi:MAG: Rrf2 family transcriptional regulator [Deltaproteobacteria bacterium]|nr:MAG: Rrf2 family transcriptional regulator [Deltaproteobacteria bacterium]
MKLTTKSRYGVRAMFDIAYNAGGLPAQIKDISERQRISPRYLEQIFQKLKKVGILGSKRGPKGGYYLRKKPEDITLYEIITATEGPIELVFCVGQDEDGASCNASCDLKEECVASPLWKDVGEQIATIFRNTTIQKLCDKAEELGIERKLDARFMYYI